MSEELATTPEAAATTPENVATTPENVATTPAPEPTPPEPKKKGRPAGAKDKAPRKRTVKIVEEALAPEPVPEAPEPVPAAPQAPEPRRAPAPAVTPPEEPPLTPRTVLRAASQHILELHRLQTAVRKTTLADIYTRGLRGLA